MFPPTNAMMSRANQEIDLSDEGFKFLKQFPDYIPYVTSPDPKRLPNWLVELRELSKLLPARSAPVSRPRPAEFRARDCKQWIKFNNRHTGGIRKKRHPEAPLPVKHAMAKPLTQAQYQRHHLHLMSCVLGLRTNASPFTLVLDDLNQRAAPLTREFMLRGLSRNLNIVYLSFESKQIRCPPGVRFLPVSHFHTGDQILQQLEHALRDFKESLVIIDSLYDILNIKGVDMTTLFNLIAMKYCSSLVGIHHQDIIPNNQASPYAPQPLEVFKYMATTVITCKSFAHVLAAKAAKERSLPEPTHGLLQGAEGIVQCLNANDTRGIVIEAEFRRKSGRTESETYFLRPSTQTDYNAPLPGLHIGTLKKEFVILIDQHRAYANKELIGLVNAAGDQDGTADEIQASFKLALTEKQRQAREAVVLPYFDAQKNMGEAGEGGRILYDMGSEDDFDEEEDEI